MTTPIVPPRANECPAEETLKQLTGKWKPQILRLASEQPVRFNALLKQMPGSNKQSVAVALKELEESGVLIKTVIKLKPLHIEYTLSGKGQAMIPLFRNLEGFSPVECSRMEGSKTT